MQIRRTPGKQYTALVFHMGSEMAITEKKVHISVSKCLCGAFLCPTLLWSPLSLWAEINDLEGCDKLTLLPETFGTKAFVP